MEMKQHLIDTFRYNNDANKKMLEKIKELPEKEESIRLFSHLINCQYKWLARIEQDANAVNMSWWEPVYDLEELSAEWDKSLDLWFKYLEGQTEAGLATELTFTGFDGGKWAAKPRDIALQLNYHSIHHRAQLQTIIRLQGLEPDFVDYIGTVYRKLT